MQEPTLAKPQKAEHNPVSKHNTKSAIEQHRNIYSSPTEGVKVQFQLLHTGEVYKRRLAKLQQRKDFYKSSMVHYLNRSPGKRSER